MQSVAERPPPIFLSVSVTSFHVQCADGSDVRY